MNLMTATPQPFPFKKESVEVGLLSHCTCEDVSALNTWEVGSGFDTNTNPTFVSMTDGNGLNCNAPAYSLLNNQTNFQAMFIDSLFMIKYTIKYTTFTVTSGISSSSALNTAYDFYNASTSQRMFHLHRSSDSGLRFYFVDSLGTTIDHRMTNINIALNEEVTWTIMHDATGIDGGSDTIRIYAGTTLKYNTTTAMDIKLNTDAYLDFMLGSTVANPTSNYLRGAIDNWKTYNAITIPT